MMTERHDNMNAEQWKGTKAHLDDIVFRYRKDFGQDSFEMGLWAVLWEYGLWAYMSKLGLELRGYSFTSREDEWLMVLKVTEGDIPKVAFLTALTPAGCMRRAWIRFERGTLELREDKYG